MKKLHEHKTPPPRTLTGTTIYYTRNMLTYRPLTLSDDEQGRHVTESGFCEFLPNSEFGVRLTDAGLIIVNLRSGNETYVNRDFIVTLLQQNTTAEEDDEFDRWYADEHNGMSPKEEHEMNERGTRAMLESIFGNGDGKGMFGGLFG